MDSNFECKSRKPVLLFSAWPDLGLCHAPPKKKLFKWPLTRFLGFTFLDKFAKSSQMQSHFPIKRIAKAPQSLRL